MATASLCGLGLAGCGLTANDPEPASASEGCEITNPVLSRAIREKLGRNPDEQLTSAELESIDQLGVSGLTTFDGLQCLTSLQRLDVAASTARDPSPLGGLSKLTELGIRGSTAPELSTLTAERAAIARSLVRLTLTQSNLADLSGLGELTALTTLDLSGNQLEDIAELERLTQLVALNLSQNRVADIKVVGKLIALESLNLNLNEVRSLESLDGHERLTVLNAKGNQLTTLDSLNLPRLTHLDAGANAITALGELSGFAALRELDLAENQIADVAGVEALGALERLVLRHNPLSELAPLAGLLALEVLDLSGTDIELLDPLARLEHVVDLDLRFTPVSDLSPLLAWPSPAGTTCRKLSVTEATLDAASSESVIVALCAGRWQVETTESGSVCEKRECNPI